MKFFGYFRDGAVIQRGKPFLVKGYAEEDIKCALIKNGAIVHQVGVHCENGAFQAKFPAVSDLKSDYEIVAKRGKEQVSCKVKFGDVYLMLGQSNMSFSLGSVEDSETWKARAAAADISVLNLHEGEFSALSEVIRPIVPLQDFCREYAWTSGGDDHITGTSALTVQTVTMLSEVQNIPVGAVHTAMGGLGVEAYLRRERVENDCDLLNFLTEAGRYQSVENYNKAGNRNYSQLSGVWNEKIAPLADLNFAGIVWYLGESSAYDYKYAEYFYKQLYYIIEDCRALFGDIPFVAVHITQEYYPYGDRYGYLYINEQLHRLAKELENVYDVPIYDIEPRWLKQDGALFYHPIHTVNKAPVAERIVRAVQKQRFPEITQVFFDKDKAICKISGVKRLDRKSFQGFAICGKNGKYYAAKAKAVSDNEIEVLSEEVKFPCALTYAFMQYQDFCDVRDINGDPLIPYRTVTEKVGHGYFFPPAFTVNGAKKVYENCFGWQVGSCMKVPVWQSGKIYRGGNVEIVCEKDGWRIKACPRNEDYFFFGVSPSMCLSGHKNHLADFHYLNAELRSSENVEFFGVILRTADGEVFRFDLKNGKETVSSMQLKGEYVVYCSNLTHGWRGDCAPVAFAKRMLRNVVDIEFLFRATTKTEVFMRNVAFSDRNLSRCEKIINKMQNRLDISLPEIKI